MRAVKSYVVMVLAAYSRLKESTAVCSPLTNIKDLGVTSMGIGVFTRRGDDSGGYQNSHDPRYIQSRVSIIHHNIETGKYCELVLVSSVSILHDD